MHALTVQSAHIDQRKKEHAARAGDQIALVAQRIVNVALNIRDQQSVYSTITVVLSNQMSYCISLIFNLFLKTCITALSTILSGEEKDVYICAPIILTSLISANAWRA